MFVRMTRNPDKMSRNVYMDTRGNTPGCMGGMLNMFDWNITNLSGKKLLTDLDFADHGLTGIEAPRNSLDVLSGGSLSYDISRSGLASKMNIPGGFKNSKSATPEESYTSDNEKRRRSPSVVARLMGLEVLPGAEPATKNEAILIGQNVMKDQVEGRHSIDYQQRRAELSAGKDLHGSRSRRRGDLEQLNENGQFETVLTREAHPQEKQLEEFKKQFASTFSSQSHEPIDPESLSRDADVKRVMIEKLMDEKKAEPPVVTNTDAKNDPSRLGAALEKLNNTKEFQDVLEVLQSNKEFFLKFLQDPNAMLSDKTVGGRLTLEKTSTVPPQPVDVKEQEAVPKPEKKKGGLSPTAFARRFMDFRKEGKASKAKSQEASRSQSETEEITTKPSSSLLPRFRRKAKAKTQEVDPGLSVRTGKEFREDYSTDGSSRMDPNSPVNIVLLRPGTPDGQAAIDHLPNVINHRKSSRAGKESIPKSCNLVEESRASQHQAQETTPKMSFDKFSDDVDPVEDISSHSKERPWLREVKDIQERERERSKESREIARDIIREARSSVAASEKVRRSSSEEMTVAGSGSSGRRISSLRSVSDREISSHSRFIDSRPISSSREEYIRQPSGLSNLSNSGDRNLNPWAAQDVVNRRTVDQRQRRDGHTSSSLQPEQHRRPGQKAIDNRPGLPRVRSVSSSSRVLRKAIAGSLMENRVLWYDSPLVDSCITLPKLHVNAGDHELIASPSQSEDESLGSSPSLSATSSLRRCRSVPNAALVRDGKSCAEENCTSSHQAHEQAGQEFGDPHKRGVEAVSSSFARAKSKQRNKIFVRSKRKSPTSCSSESRQDSNLGIRSFSSLFRAELASEDLACAQLTERSSEDAGNEIETSDNSDEMSEVLFKRFPISNETGLKISENHAQLAGPYVEQQMMKGKLLSHKGQQVRVTADLATDQSSRSTDAITDILEVSCCVLRDGLRVDVSHFLHLDCSSEMVDRRIHKCQPNLLLPFFDCNDVMTGVQVSAGDKLASIPKIRSVAPQSPKIEDDDARDTGGHPSPVSVFDSVFDQDSPRPPEFSDISPELQEFRIDLPKFDRGDAETREAHQELKDSNCEPWTPGVAREICRDEGEWFQTVDLEGFPYPEGNRDDLVYVRNLLVVSEFVESVSKVFTRWHSSCQPLHPILFENLEDYYNQRIYEPQFRIKNGHIKSTGVADARPLHIMLFDAVNEALLRKLSPYLSVWPWFHPSAHHMRGPLPLGKDLVLETWIELCGYFPSSNENEDAAALLLDRDLGRRHEWAAENVEELGLELENAIFFDLIDETVQSLISISFSHKRQPAQSQVWLAV